MKSLWYVLVLLLPLGLLAQTGEKPVDRSYYQAQLLYNDGELEEAKAHLKSHLKQFPNDHPGYALQAMVHYDLGEYETAWAHIDKALSYRPREALYQRNAGLIKMALGKPAEAERHYLMYISKQPGKTEGYELLGEAMLAQEKYDEAAEIIATGLRIDGENEWLLIQQAQVLLRLEAYEEALETTEQLTRLYPTNGKGFLLHGKTLLGLTQDGYCEAFATAHKLGEPKAMSLLMGYCEE